ncbi:MAG: PKD domain-containing protein [Candidatus Staskawiczbacteria bacterium]|nr:PKD domain-containing protein [Candidatus Staskawiczbacteria bacterium]
MQKLFYNNIKKSFTFLKILLSVGVFISAGIFYFNSGKQVSALTTPVLTVSCNAVPNLVYRNQQIKWTATPGGRIGPYTYKWSGDVSGKASFEMDSYTTSGTKIATVTVVAGSASATVQCGAIVLPGWPALSASCSTSKPTSLINRQVNWYVNASGGNGQYTYQWNGDVTGKSQVVSTSYALAGTKNASVIVTSGGISKTIQCSSTNILTNWPPLSATCSASPHSAIQNQEVNWSVTATGGDGSYSYSWAGDDSLSGNSSSIQKTYLTTGIKVATVTVTDSTGNSTVAQCNAPIGWNNNISVSCHASTSSAFVGQQISWIATASGGGRIYTGGSASSLSSSSLSNSSFTSSSSESSVNSSTSSLSGSSSSSSSSYSAPKICSSNYDCSSGEVCVENLCVPAQATEVTVAYQWSGDVTGDSYIMSGAYTTPGTKNVSVTAIDAFGHSATSECSLVVTSAPLVVYCYPSSNSASPDQQISWVAGASGGIVTSGKTYTYSWTGTDGLSGTSSYVSMKYLTTGVKKATVTATDSDGHSVTNVCGNAVSVNLPSLSVSCSVSPSSIAIGHRAKWTATVSGGKGAGTYTYSWTGTDGLSGALSSVLKTYSVAGVKKTTVTVTSGGLSATSPACYVNVSS